MSADFSPITPVLGACVQGVSLATIDVPQLDALYRVWQQRHVMVLREQQLNNAQFERFSAMLGELDPPPNQGAGRKSVPGHPNLYVVSNRKNGAGEPIGALGDGEAQWHTDMSYLERPPFASMLWSIELPETGGDTCFTSMPAALRSMPDSLVERIQRLSIKHDGTYDSSGSVRKGMTPNDDPTRSVGTNHPIVIEQPETGERTLYLGRRRNAYIPGLPLAESETLLNLIWGYATAPQVTMRHQWRLGDVVLWNNFTTMHRRDGFPADQFRTLHRSQIKGKYVPTGRSGAERGSMISRRNFSKALGAAPLVYAAGSRADESYPNRPIRLLVGLAPGGIADITARFIAPRLGEILGKQVIVENRTGAGGAIATRSVATSAPDGYTLLMAFDGTHVTLPAANPRIGFEPVTDFAMIGKVVDAPVMITAHPSFPAKDFGEFITLSRRAIGSSDGIRIYDYGTSGIASTGHLTMELLKQRLGFYALHIPYRGGGDARAQVLGRQIPLMLAAVPATSGDVRSGMLKGLAVTSATRSPVLPGVPSLCELGFKELDGMDINSWVGLMAPARTPPAIVARLDSALRQTLATDEVYSRLVNAGSTPVKSSPEAFKSQVSGDLTRWRNVIRDSQLRLEA